MPFLSWLFGFNSGAWDFCAARSREGDTCSCSLTKVCLVHKCDCSRPRFCIEKGCRCSRTKACENLHCSCGRPKVNLNEFIPRGSSITSHYSGDMCPKCKGIGNLTSHYEGYDGGKHVSVNTCHLCLGTGSVRSATRQDVNVTCPQCHGNKCYTQIVTEMTRKPAYWPDGSLREAGIERSVEKTFPCGICDQKGYYTRTHYRIITPNGDERLFVYSSLEQHTFN